MEYLTHEEQYFLYNIFIKESVEQKTECNGEYAIINKLHSADLVRKIKRPNTNHIELRLTDLGKAQAIIIARINKDRKLDKGIVIGFW